MRLFSTFDTSRKYNILDTEREKHGEENVLVIHKSKLFFYTQVVFPAVMLLVLLAASIVFFGFGTKDMSQVFSTFVYIMIGVIFLSLFLPVIKKYIDFQMDYVVITPQHTICHDQEGMLRRDIITLHNKSIKTVTIKKSGIFNSLFNEGEIIILSEGDLVGKISIGYVFDPEYTKKKIHNIMENR